VSLVLHPTSDALLTKVTARLPHALLLSADEGVGLGTIAREVAHAHSTHAIIVLPEKDDKIDLEKGSITVDSIRRLYSQARTKQAGERVIVVDYAERMSHQAQNAFLKLLEEPAEGTSFILASHEPSRLLPTIRSRVQHVELRRITDEQSNTLLDSLGIQDATKRSQLLFMASGLPAELIRFHQNDEYFTHRVSIMRDARTFLQGSAYDKLLLALAYKDDRPKALLMIKDCIKIIEHSLKSQPQAKLIKQLSRLTGTYDAIEANGNIRLQLLMLVV
jgi:DNA polymerase-3 subunit delta'